MVVELSPLPLSSSLRSKEGRREREGEYPSNALQQQVMKNNTKQIAEYRPLPEQEVVFIDKKTRSSDAGTLELPQVGEVCVIRAVMTATLLDTEEKGTGIYLNGYTNPIDGGCVEYCYEAERFIPLALAKIYCENNITAGSVIVSPVPYNGHMIKLHMDLIKHFEESNLLCEPHPDGNGIDAALAAKIGNLPVKIRYEDGQVVVTRCFSPIRIQPEHKAQINELTNRLNHKIETPHYGIDSRTNLAYSTVLVNPISWATEKDPAARLIGFNIFLTTRLFHAMTKVMYGGLSPAMAIAELDNKETTDKSSPTKRGEIIGLHEFFGTEKLANSQLKRN